MLRSLMTLQTVLVAAMLLLFGADAALAQGPESENYVKLDEVYVANGESFAYPVTLFNAAFLSGIRVPLRLFIGDYITIDSVSTAGMRLDGVGSVTTSFDNATHKLYIEFAASMLSDPWPLTPLSPGNGPIAAVYLTVDQHSPTHNVLVDTTVFPLELTYSLKDTGGTEVADDFVEGLIHIKTRRPVIELNPKVFYFTSVIGVDPPAQTLLITNLGENPLNWTITAKPSWLKTSSFSGTAPSDVDLMPEVAALPIGSYLDSIAVTDDSAVIKTVWAPIHLDITDIPKPEVAGIVEDTLGQPISGATVELWDVFPSGSVLQTMATGGSGEFGFFGVLPGDYDLYAYKNGYYPTKLAITSPNDSIVIVLVPTPPVPPTNKWIDLYCEENYFEGYLLPKGTVVEALDQSGVVCGQFFVHTVGQYGFMPVYRDDWTTPGIDEGADSLETLAIEINTFPASAFPTPVWTYHGDVQEVCLNTEVIDTLCIGLSKGWNLISWNLDTPDDRIETIIAEIKGCLDVILGFEAGGATYDPDLPLFSTLDYLDHLHGYWFRMECDTQLCVIGTRVSPATPIDLEANWNLVSYLPDDDDSTAHALGSVLDKLVVALGFDKGAQTYDPLHPELATLLLLRPAFGYWLKTTAPATLVYPGPVFSSASYPVSFSTMKAYPPAPGVIPTPEWVDLYGDGLTLDGVLIPEGSTIAMYDEQGNLCGQATVQAGGKIAFTPVYADVIVDAVDQGADYGGRVNLTVNGISVRETCPFTEFGDRIKLGPLTSLAKPSQSLPKQFELTQNFPNPFNPGTVIEFSLPAAARATVEIYNLLGVRITTLVDRYLPAGKYSVTWDGVGADGKPVASGVYFYRLSAGNFSDTRKMLLVK